MLMLLECREISYRYPNAELPLFDGLSFCLDTPGFHALFGPSGVGKTSLAKIISGRVTGFSGEVRPHTPHPPLYTYNLERLPDWSPVGKHLEKITPADERPRLDALVHLFGMEAHLDRRFSRLSLGQKNRVNLIRYLLQDFEVLVMDESLANVDEKTRERIILAMKDYFSQRCFLYISHNVSEVARFCHRIFVLRSWNCPPQILPLLGCNQTGGQRPDPESLSRIKLEIMNAV
jgi:ABC-type multidrug transport system ATPase subunit